MTNEPPSEEKKDEESGSKTAKRALFQDEPPDAKRQKGTPPGPLALPNQEHQEKKTAEENKPRPVKMQLFQDEQPSEKKQKATIEHSTAEKGRTKAAEKKQHS